MRVSVDTGGTFTDVLLEVGGRLVTCKLPSTPDDPGRAVREGVREVLRRAGLSEAAPPVLHGTTVATNALLERRGARVLLLTTAGFEDVLALGRQAREGLYSLVPRGRDPWVARADTMGVRERVLADGGVEVALSRSEALEAWLEERLSQGEGGAISVAICLLHAYVNDAHERALEAWLEERHPGLSVSRSSDVLAEFREYERCATTVANAAIAPVMSQYLRRLEASEVVGGLRVMQSSGGLMRAEAAARYPVHTALSGPAGGVVGGWLSAREAGFDAAVTFDMGGTSTDVAMCAGGWQLTTSGSVGGLPIGVPMIDIHTVGAGGGSIARVDVGGALKVGPESAGADPGPACYGRGEEATVSDANLVLGRLLEASFLGGEMRLDRGRAERALEPIASAMGVGVEAAAEGVLEVAVAAMARAIKVISVERGHDPRRLALVAFGGAGALHACALAEELGMASVVVPREPGLLSAFGMLNARLERHGARTVMWALQSERPSEGFEARLSEVIGALSEALAEELARDGASSPRFEVSLDMRYAGQSFELRVALGEGEGLAAAREAFEAAHEARYGYRLSARRVEVVTVRVRGIGLEARVSHAPPERLEGEVLERARLGSGRVRFEGRWFEGVPWLERGKLGAGDRVEGPAIVAEYSATTVVAPGWSARVTDEGTLVLEVR